METERDVKEMERERVKISEDSLSFKKIKSIKTLYSIRDPKMRTPR